MSLRQQPKQLRLVTELQPGETLRRTVTLSTGDTSTMGQYYAQKRAAITGEQNDDYGR